MTINIQILIVEDSEDDTELVLHWLRSDGYVVEFLRVETEAAFRNALDSDTWDIILSDFALPKFSVDRALEIVRENKIDIPFIVISGVVAMDRAVRLMKDGAHDFISKDDQARLVPAIQRELREVEMRREKMLAEKSLRESRARFEDFAAASADWFWEMDSELRFTYLSENISEITGLSAEWYLGKTRDEVMGEGNDPDAVTEYLEAVRERSPFRGLEYSILTKEGEAVWLSISGVPVFDDEATFIGYRGVGSDITDRRRINEQFQQSQKMEAVGQLTSGIAHDFNNILAVIQGNSDLLNHGPVEMQDEFLQAIVRASKRGAELSHRLLAFSRRQTLRPRQIDLAKLIHSMADLLKRTLGETIEVETVGEDGLVFVMADPGQVENALLNLAINARDAMGSGGKLKIECQIAHLKESDVAHNPEAMAGSYGVIAVSDDGVGMPAEVLARAFEPFFTTKDVGKGSGLGLSMIYGFAKQSGGHVDIHSQEGCGTTVCLYLVRTSNEYQPEAIRNVAEVVPGEGHVILVIEDDDDVRRMIGKMLTKIGYQVIVASEAASARSIFSQGKKIDLVLSDVVLPGGVSGPELADELRGSRPDLLTLFMSGYPAENAERFGLVGSERDLLNKPFDMVQLAEAVRDALDS